MTERPQVILRKDLDPQEIEARRERLAQRNFLEEILALRDLQRAKQAEAIAIAKADSIPWELNRQGLMRWYMAPTMDDIVVNTLTLYVQRIPAFSRSGKQLTQGGQIGFIWKGGSGYTIIDDERHDWDVNDVIQVPLRPKGCVVQHFSNSEQALDIIFAEPNVAYSASVDRGAGFEQIEDCPEFATGDRSAVLGH